MKKNINKENFFRSSIVILIALVLALIFRETGNSFVVKWLKFDESLGHGFLIVSITIYHIFIDGQGYTVEKENSKHWLLPIIVLGFIFQFITLFWGILIFQQLGLYTLWILISIYILGTKFNKKIAFPLFFFLFAIPFWDFLNPVLLDLTTVVVTSFLKLTTLVVFIQENRIETPYGVIEIANGCSGLKFFEIALVLSTYAVYLEKMTIKSKAIIIIAGAALGIITNWLRVTLLIFIGYESKMESSLMADHETFGFILFFIVISSVIFLLKKFRLPDSDENEIITNEDKAKFPLKVFGLRCLLLLVCYLFILPLNNIMQSTPLDKIEKKSQPHLLLNDQGSYLQTSTDININGKACINTKREYDFNKPGTDVIPYKTIYNKPLFNQVEKMPISLKVNDKIINVIQLTLISRINKEQFTLYYWYQYNNLSITNHYFAKLLEITYLVRSEKKLELRAIVCQPK